MESSGIKSSTIRPQDLGQSRPQVRRVTPRADESGNAGAAESGVRRRVADPENLVSANGRVYDRTAPRGTYLNIVV